MNRLRDALAQANIAQTNIEIRSSLLKLSQEFTIFSNCIVIASQNQVINDFNADIRCVLIVSIII